MKNTGTHHRKGQTGQLVNTELTKLALYIKKSHSLHSLNQANEVQWLTLGW